jgi:hypothetical protein
MQTSSQVAMYTSAKDKVISLIQIAPDAWKVQEYRNGITSGSIYRGKDAKMRARIAFDVRVAL